MVHNHYDCIRHHYVQVVIAKGYQLARCFSGTFEHATGGAPFCVELFCTSFMSIDKIQANGRADVLIIADNEDIWPAARQVNLDQADTQLTFLLRVVASYLHPA